ncbi:hypothetical protein RAZWK3B_19191 [Roseobacter sp. AzwK-3b]|nr:hypothetical protein RAZWK3B_19191 [Roseobacter sp. AzwK-3b]
MLGCAGPFSHGRNIDIDAVSIFNDLVADSVGEGGFADDLMR